MDDLGRMGSDLHSSLAEAQSARRWPRPVLAIMDGPQQHGSRCFRDSLTRSLLTVLTGVLSVAAVGCADHRISLDQFLAMEKKQTAAAQPSEATLTLESPTPRCLIQPYKVGSGDVLAVTRLTLDQTTDTLPLLVRVDRDGFINLPRAGKVAVEDLELEDAERAIENSYVPQLFQHAAIHVELADPSDIEVVVTGAALSPGIVHLRRAERDLLHAIAAAGGMTDLASGSVTLERMNGQAEELTINLKDREGLSDALRAPPLMDGDLVTVHAADPNSIFVGGLVNRIGMQSYPPGTTVTVLQALARAGGLRTDVVPKEGTLVRRMSNGEDVHVRLDLTRMATNMDKNLDLQAGDILWVPETWETRVLDFINRNIFLRAGVSVTYEVTGLEFMNRAAVQSNRFGGSQQDSFDPLGFLGRNTLLQGISGQPGPEP